MQTFLEDIQFAYRNFFKIPGVCLLIVATLALGIGANAAIFSMVYNVLLGPLPFQDGEQLVKIETNNPSIDRQDVPISVATMFDYRLGAEALSHVVEYHQMNFTLLGHGDPSYVETGVTSWDYFEMLGIKPILGRTFLPGEDEPGARPLIILSNRYWLEKFGGDPNVVGMNLEMNNAGHQVIGVLPPMPAYPVDNDIWISAASCPGRSSNAWINNRGFNALTLYGKLKDEVSLEQGSQDLNSISQRLMAEYPDTYKAENGLSNTLVSLRTEMAGDSSKTFLLLMVITALVLLIACANVANLNLARMSLREQELAIREALGANPRRIVRQILTESVLLSFAGGLFGLLIAFLSIDLLSGFAARYTPLSSEVELNSSVLIFCLLISVLTGVISGSGAAFRKRNINTALKEGGGNITASSSNKKLQQALLVLQFSLAFIILTCASLVSLSMYRLNNQDTGFATEEIIAVDMSLNFTDYSLQAPRRQFARQLSQELENHPLIDQVGFGAVFPLAEGLREATFFQIEGKTPASIAERPDAIMNSASENYHSILNIPLLQGRYLLPSDDENSPGSIVINQEFARQFFGDVNPIDQRISIDEGKTWLSVRGVVGDIREQGIDVPAEPSFYVSYLEFPTYQFRLLIKSQANLTQLNPAIRDIVNGVNPRQAVTNITTLEVIRNNWLSPSQLAGLLISIFAVLAFTITLSGVIGVVAYNISQRQKEIGIRMALGANPRHVRKMFLLNGLALGSIGIAIGAVVVMFFAPMLLEILYETSPLNINMYLLTAFIVAIAATIAILLPTQQAVAIQPTRALRDQ